MPQPPIIAPCEHCGAINTLEEHPNPPAERKEQYKFGFFCTKCGKWSNGTATV